MTKVYISETVVTMLNELFNSSFSSEVDISYGFTYITVSPNDKRKLSGMATNMKLQCAPMEDYRNDKGTYLKPGKLLSALFPDKDNNEISTMGAKLSAHMTGKSDNLYDRLQASRTPSYVYGLDHGDGGQLGCSCMRGQDSSMFELYDEATDMGIVYLMDEDSEYLIGRALLHDSVYNVTEDTYMKLMDRVYVCNDNNLALFYRWAREHGYHRKREQACNSHYSLVSPSGIVFSEHTLAIVCPGSNYDMVPYMDTFTWYFRDDDTLRNYSRGSADELCHIDGTTYNGVLAHGNYDCTCEDCGRGLWYDDARSIGDSYSVCNSCYNSNYTMCDRCEESYHDDNVSNVYYNGSGWTSNICEGCLGDLERCDVCSIYFDDGETEELRRTIHGPIEDVCCNCQEDMTECDECGTFRPEEVKECAYCYMMAKRRGMRERVYPALIKRLEMSSLWVHNSSEKGTFLFEGDLYRLQPVAGNSIVLQKNVIVRPHPWESRVFDETRWIEDKRYFATTSFHELVDRVLRMIVPLEPEPVINDYINWSQKPIVATHTEYSVLEQLLNAA